MGFLGALLGGSESSSSSTTQNTDKRLAVDHGVGVTGDSNTTSMVVNTTLSDSGAVSGGVALGGHSLDTMQNTTAFALIASNEAGKRELAATQAALDAAAQANRDAIAATQKTAADAIGAVGTANKMALDFSGQTIKDSYALVSGNMAAVLGLETHVVDAAFQQNKDVRDAFATATADVNRAWDTASQFQIDKVTADSKYLVYAFVGLIAVMAFKGGK